MSESECVWVCVCVCVPMCECLLTTSPISVGPLQRLGSSTVTDAPVVSLDPLSRQQTKKERVRVMSTVIEKGGGTMGGGET